MEHGQVRAILGRHAGASLPGGASDPTLLVPASVLRRRLEGLPDAEQRRLAHDYVALWRRTFRTLANHLRGRPGRALALFAEEVYPFLRGDRRAARVERRAAREARVLLADDLPAPYLCGLLEGFVGLSGASVVARADGAGAFTVAFRVAAADYMDPEFLPRLVSQVKALGAAGNGASGRLIRLRHRHPVFCRRRWRSPSRPWVWWRRWRAGSRRSARRGSSRPTATPPATSSSTTRPRSWRWSATSCSRARSAAGTSRAATSSS